MTTPTSANESFQTVKYKQTGGMDRLGSMLSRPRMIELGEIWSKDASLETPSLLCRLRSPVLA